MTYSIVARCHETGMLGLGIATALPCVGRLARYVEPGCGVVATQSATLMAHGSRVLAGLREGRSAEQALAESLAADELPAVRQVAVVSASGEVAVHTGAGCIAVAGHVAGDGFCVQANMMAAPGVPEAMAAAFADARGRLSERLVVALEAAETCGGDVRGRQSAALMVARPEATGDPLADVVSDVRVDDSAEPLPELRRLERVAWAYELVGAVDELVAAGEVEAAQARSAEALALAPGTLAFPFGLAKALATAGHDVQARDAWRQVVESGEEERWSNLLSRLVAADLVSRQAAETLVRH